MTKVKQEYKEIMAHAAKTFMEKGCTSCLDGGDMSMIDPETGYIYIFPRPGVTMDIPNWSLLTPAQIPVVNIEGQYIEDNGIKATVEMPMHLEIYKARPETRVILHTHAVWSSAFAVAGKDIPFVLPEQGVILGGGTPCAEYGLVATEDLGHKIVDALGAEGCTALLRNHGAVILAASIDEAFSKHEMMERASEIALKAHMLGGAVELDPDNYIDWDACANDAGLARA